METQEKTMFGNTELKQVLTEEQIKLIHPVYGSISIAVVLYVTRLQDDAGKKLLWPEYLSITEKKTFGETEGFITKCPAGGMNHEDINFFAAGNRELFTETGYVVEKLHFSFAVETSSTSKVPGERHFIVYLCGENAKKVGEPSEASIVKVEWVPINRLIPGFTITHSQSIGVKPSFNTFSNLDKDHAIGFMHSAM